MVSQRKRAEARRGLERYGFDDAALRTDKRVTAMMPWSLTARQVYDGTVAVRVS